MRFGSAATGIFMSLAAATPLIAQTAPSGPALAAMDAKQQSAQIAILVSQQSPLLSNAAKIAISQDFYGAPLSGKPAIHTVKAESVTCRARNQKPEGTGATCEIRYAKDKSAKLSGEEAKVLFIALGKVGILSDGAAGSVNRQIKDLTCSVNDKMAQETPSSGNVVAGFSCKFKGEKGV